MSPDTLPPSPINLQYLGSVICFGVLFVATPRRMPPQSHLLRAMINGNSDARGPRECWPRRTSRKVSDYWAQSRSAAKVRDWIKVACYCRLTNPPGRATPSVELSP